MAALAAVSTSCFRDEDFDLDMLAKDQNVDYDLAVPLFETRLTIANLLSVFGRDENFPAGDDGLVHLVYALDKPLRFDIGNKITIPAITLAGFDIANVPYWKKDTVLSVTQYDTIGIDIRGLQENASINRIALDSILITLTGSYGIGMASTIDIRFTNVLQNGQPLALRLNLEKGAGLSYAYLYEDVEMVFEGEYRINPCIIYEVRFTGDMNTAENEFPDVRTGQVSMRPEFGQIVYDRIEGYIGKFDINFKDVLDVSLLQNLNVEDMQFYEGTVNVVSTLDGCSVPIYINESGLICHFGSDYPSADVDMYPENYTLPYPEPTDATLTKTSVQQIDIHSLLAHKPKAFNYLIDATLNGGENNAPLNIIKRSCGLDMNIACDLPLHFRINQFVMDDTLAFTGIEQIDLIKRFFLKGIVTNAFPLEVYLHLDFLDARGNVLFSPIDGDTVAGGRVGETLHVEEPGVYRLDTELSSDEVAMLKETASIRVWAIVSTYDKGEAKIYVNSDEEGFLRVKLGARAMLRLGDLIGDML